jgi:hypothetical protein
MSCISVPTSPLPVRQDANQNVVALLATPVARRTRFNLSTLYSLANDRIFVNSEGIHPERLREG